MGGGGGGGGGFGGRGRGRGGGRDGGKRFTSDFLSRTEKSEKGKIDLIKVKMFNKSPRNNFGPNH